MEEEKKYIWLDKKEFLKEFGFNKILYYTGVYEFKDCTKYAKSKRFISPDKKQIHAHFQYMAWFGPRWWHPLTWLFVLFIGIIAFICNIWKAIVEVMTALPKELTQEIHVHKSLKTEDGSKVY